MTTLLKKNTGVKRTRFNISPSFNEYYFTDQVMEEQRTIHVFSINTLYPIEVYNLNDEDLTMYSLNLVEDSLREDWEDEDDEHWNSFLN